MNTVVRRRPLPESGTRLLFLAAAIAVAGTAAATPSFGSCLAARESGIALDGEYELELAPGIEVTVFCYMMGARVAEAEPAAPFEYISLPTPNVAQWIMGLNTVTTTFTRVRIDLANLTIRTSDFTFSETTVRDSSSELANTDPGTLCAPGGERGDTDCFADQPPASCSSSVPLEHGVPFGTAGWCSSNSPTCDGSAAAAMPSAANATIDLTGTSFVLDDNTSLAVEFDYACVARQQLGAQACQNNSRTTINAVRDVLSTSVLFREGGTFCAAVWDLRWVPDDLAASASRRQGGSSISIRPRQGAGSSSPTEAGFVETGYEQHLFR